MGRVDASLGQSGVHSLLNLLLNGFFLTNFQLTVNEFLTDSLFVHCDWVHGGNLHGHFMGDGFGGLSVFVESGDDGQAVTHVVVSAHESLFQAGESVQFNLLTCFAAHFGQTVFDCLSVEIGLHQRLLGGDVLADCQVRQGVGVVGEVGGFAHKVGFAVHHDDHAESVVGSGFGHHIAFVGVTVGTFCCNFLTFFPQDINSFFKIAFGFHQSVFAVHHA